MRPGAGEFVHSFGDVHLYNNHFEQAQLQLTRKPYALPVMKLNPAVKDIFSFEYEDFTPWRTANSILISKPPVCSMISIIVAASDNNVIGIENRLPWNLPRTCSFQEHDLGQPGDHGPENFRIHGGKPLKGRQNIVITRQKDYAPEGATVVSSINAAIIDRGRF